MGIDFLALVRYPGPRDEKVLQAISGLERRSPRLVRNFHKAWIADGNFDAKVPRGWETGWGRRQRPLSKRPKLPNLNARLRLPENFFLTFGRDTIRIWNLMRLLTFLTNPKMRRAILEATAELCEFLHASDCIITGDDNAVVEAFHDGSTFEEALKHAKPGERALKRVKDMYRRIPYHGQWTWDYKGYWRFEGKHLVEMNPPRLVRS